MTEKKSAPKASNTKDSAIDAALSLAAGMPWKDVTMEEIAEEADLSLADLREYFDGKTDILAAWGRRLDAQAMKAVPADDKSLSPRDRLFDLLMERYDLLNDDRDAVTSILNSFRCDPVQGLMSLPYLARSMEWMLKQAGIETGGMTGAGRVLGLTLVHLETLRHWINDESEDLSATMAALDKNLSRAERAAAYWPG